MRRKAYALAAHGQHLPEWLNGMEVRNGMDVASAMEVAGAASVKP